MLLAHQRAEVLSSVLDLDLGRAGIGQEQVAWTVFRNGGKISGLGAVDGAGAGEQEALGTCCYS